MELKSVGFIGLGAMGMPMAKNVLKKGYELHVSSHKNRKPIEELKKYGAIEHISIADIISHSQVLISILPTDNEMENVLLSDQVLKSFNSDKILIEMTSGSPGMMKKIHAAYQEKRIRVLDAPVSGGTFGAEQGNLTVIAGGDSEVLEKARPVLEAMAQSIYLVGSIGAGKAIKAINQMLAGIQMIASAEAVALAEQLDVDMDMLKQVIGNSSGASWMLVNKLDSLLKRDFAPGFKLSLMKKDIQIAVDEGKNKELPLSSFALQLYKTSEKEFGEQDFSAIGKNILS
ncbi:NAD(P)-dependent oxidoreductase [Peribacillus sp. NPDC101481]|uniref:NAD(P)-dependent oxidoreductase n=1 Tax=Peribacillus sp. NPDC101481 TaxID=3364403 RepID=UPI0037F1A858